MHASTRRFTRRVDLASLQLFVAVGEMGSIGKTAERESIAASAVSKRLSNLEDALGTPLLYRHARGVDLTAAGETFLRHARSLLFSLDKMQAELSEYAEGVRGHVRIHANISAILQFLPEDLGGFVAKHEEVKIDLEEHVSSDIVRAVRDGDADIGICSQQATNTGQLQSRPYQRDKLVLVVPRGHALAALPSVRFEDTLDYDHVGLHINSAIYIGLRHAAAEAGRIIKLRIRVTSLDAMCRMIHNGLGIGVLPDRAFEVLHSLGDLHAVPLTDEWSERGLQLVARDFDGLPAAARVLVDHLSECAARRPGAKLAGA
ncbi:LysR family transcriptional regulator [Ramlibacter sp.]|uniref:LysR family transcriptional regulator n=1 Tax=Ramlibacter sp. TaxID=1917967 RepID=UPI0018414BD6|nr:LysR family transcriptional regulator [Ramlibacter sp.]MBA2672220.1 LysR family transcriptional regulator [Ramlibacter sp.]